MLLIDDRQVPFQIGQTILEAAATAGIDIPTLCHWKEAGHCDFCRICVVEVKGSDRLLPACSTTAQDGMEVWSESGNVVASRRTTVEMLLGSGRHDCLTCVANGDCVLQDIANRYSVPAPLTQPSADSFPVAAHEPFIVRDYSKCILCARCIAACNTIQVQGAIPNPFGRRAEHPGVAGWFPLPDPDKCVSCGECMAHCPVAAIVPRQPAGLPDREVETTCAYCGCGCGIKLQVRGDRIVGVKGVEGHPASRGSLCVKGRFGYSFVHHPDRLTTPLIRKGDELVPAGWDEALDLVAAKLHEHHGKFGMLASAKCTNEDNYAAQKFARMVMRTNNLDHCARR